MNNLSKVLFILGFGIPFGFFIYRLGKNLGQIIAFLRDIISKNKSGNDV
jgi:hypothetical protein